MRGAVRPCLLFACIDIDVFPHNLLEEAPDYSDEQRAVGMFDQRLRQSRCGGVDVVIAGL
jgi:hypothetical protein